jgi:hypothetical protein
LWGNDFDGAKQELADMAESELTCQSIFLSIAMKNLPDFFRVVAHVLHWSNVGPTISMHRGVQLP